MKRYIAIITLISVFFTVCSSVYADDAGKQMKEVLASVKERIPSTDVFDVFDSNMYTYDGITQFRFEWEHTDTDSDEYQSMHATAVTDGTIVNFSSYDSSADKYISQKPTLKGKMASEAKEYARALMNKLNPHISEMYVLSEGDGYESLYDDGYSFELQRYENGIPVYGDEGYIAIDSACSKILNYRIDYMPITDFPTLDGMRTVEEAQEAYAEKLTPELVYTTSYEDGKKIPYLAYVQREYNAYIDARTLEVVSPSSANFGYKGAAYESASDSVNAAGSVGFTDVELKEIDAVEGLISQEDAVKIVSSNKALDFAPDLKAEYCEVYKRDNGQFVYTLSFENDDEEVYRYANATIDGVTGELLGYYCNSGKTDKTKVFSESDGRKAALTIAAGYYSEDERGEYRFDAQNDNYFTFVRYINDIPYYQNTINIALSKENGLITSFTLNRLEADFPSPEGIISTQEAIDKIFEQISYSAYYYPVCTSEKSAVNDSALLVYMTDPNTSVSVRADSGELSDMNRKIAVGNYTDVSGHYAESIINTLAKYGIGFEEDEFRPDDIITQKEYVSLLTSVVEYHSPIIIHKEYDFTSDYGRAVANGIVYPDEKNPDELITRENAAVYFIRAIGLEKVASLEGIYVPLYTDVLKNNGFISILTAMGVVSGYDGLFRPESPLSRADAMIMIYNYLTK